MVGLIAGIDSEEQASGAEPQTDKMSLKVEWFRSVQARHPEVPAF